MAHKLRWLVGNGPKIYLLNMRQWSHKEIEGRILKPVAWTTSQTESVWSCYVDRNKLGQMGPIKMGGGASTWWSVIVTVHCGVGEVGPNSSFADFAWSDRRFRVSRLAGKSYHWISSFWWFIYWIWSPGGPPLAFWGFMGTRSHILRDKVHPGCTCWAIMSALGAPFSQIGAPWPLLGGFLMVGMSDISFLLCAGWWRSNGGRETVRV